MSSEDRNLSLADRYLTETGRGKIPDMITRDLYFGLEAGKKRLEKLGVTLREEYLFYDDAFRASMELTPEDSPQPFHARRVCRETRRILEFSRPGKKTVRRESPVTFYADIIDHRGRGDLAASCPNCGGAALASQLEKGCPWCSTRFAMSGLYPRISACYCVEDAIWRHGFDERQKKRYLITAGILFPAFFLLNLVLQGLDPEEYIWLQILVFLFMSALETAMMTFVLFMAGRFLILGRFFFLAGSSLSMMGVHSSRRRLKERMRRFDPDFSTELFEGKLVSLLSAVLYSDDRENLSFYQGRDDLSSFDGLALFGYRGGFTLKEVKVTGGRTLLTLGVFADNVYAGKSFRRRKEKILVRMERRADARTDAGFSFHAVSCPSCGASFDAVHERHCPYCGSAFEAAGRDWVITMIGKQ